MEFSSQNDGGGGYRGRSSPLTSLLSTSARHDSGRTQPRPPQAAQDGPPDPAPSNPGQPPPVPAVVLSLDQIRVNRCSNEYTDGPAVVAQKSPAAQQRGQHKDDAVVAPSPAPRTNSERRETPEERPNNIRNLLPQVPRGGDSSPQSSGAEDCVDVGSVASSGQEQIIRTQPKHAELSPDELKPLSDASSGVAVRLPGLPGGGSHLADRCEGCGRCRCARCARPRALPSCWLCGRRCVCSADTALDYGTCACCVKGLFYHCSSDDEDTCADKPFSCAQSHCCVRWAAVSLLALILPCLFCYLPAKGCLAACQGCYGCVARQGCRCEGAHAAVHHEAADKPA